MYYNGYIIICIFIGAFLGSFVFHWEALTNAGYVLACPLLNSWEEKKKSCLLAPPVLVLSCVARRAWEDLPAATLPPGYPQLGNLSAARNPTELCDHITSFSGANISREPLEPATPVPPRRLRYAAANRTREPSRAHCTPDTETLLPEPVALFSGNADTLICRV